MKYSRLLQPAFVLTSLGFAIVTFCIVTWIWRATQTTDVVGASPNGAPTVQQAADAIHRMAPHSDQLCYDEERNGWYIRWPDGPDTTVMHGMYYIDHVPLFNIKKNNSWYTTYLADDRLVEVAPITTDLECYNYNKEN